MKWPSALFIMFLMMHTTNAGVFQKIDKLLLEENIVNQDYVYIDEKRAYQVFRIMGNTVAASLPVSLNSYTEATSAILTPYMISYYYTIDLDSSDESIEEIRENLAADYYIKNLCDNMFDAKFQKANDFVFNGFFRDTEGASISHVVLNKEICSKKVRDHSDLFN